MQIGLDGVVDVGETIRRERRARLADLTQGRKLVVLFGHHALSLQEAQVARAGAEDCHLEIRDQAPKRPQVCLLYTSDAADDLLCVDLGGRRIIKKKKTQKNKL